MRRLKKSCVAVLTALACLTVPLNVSAASGVSADEQKVLDTAYEAAVSHGTAGNKTFQSYYSQAERWMAENELTAEQCSTLAKAISEAAASNRKAAAGKDENSAIAAGNTVKQIELDGDITACVILGLAASFIICSIIFKKKGLFAAEG